MKNKAKRILFVDDRKDRYETLCREQRDADIVHAATTDIAVMHIVDDCRKPAKQRFNEIHLDYNLDGLTTGMNIVHVLGCFTRYYPDVKIICHSSMPERGLKMEYKLRRYGYRNIEVESFDYAPGRPQPRRGKGPAYQGYWDLPREGEFRYLDDILDVEGVKP